MNLPPIGTVVTGTTGSGRTVTGALRSHDSVLGRDGYVPVIQAGGARIWVLAASLAEGARR